MLKKIGLLSASVVSGFAMHTAELNINDKDLQIKASVDLGQFNETVDPNTTYLGASYLNANEEHSDIKDGGSLKTDGYYETSFLMRREIKESGVLFGIGVKANYANLKTGASNVGDRTFISIPLGIEAGFKLPVAIPVILDAKVYYAPESLAFSDADNYLEYGVGVSVEVIERGSIVAGFRNLDTNIKVNTTTYKINYNKSGYFGFKFAF
jgi:hypothetical protein